MHVHIPQPRDQKLARGIDHYRVRDSLHARLHRHDAPRAHYHREVLFRRRPGSVDHRSVFKHQRLRESR